MKVRRVVTGHSGGKSVFVSDSPAPRTRDFKSMPGQSSTVVWATPGRPVVPCNGAEVVSQEMPFLPETGGTRMLIVTFAPDAVLMSKDFDPAAAGQEFFEEAPDFAAKFEMDSPGMHTTDTVDYGIVLEGEVWLELDDGKQVHLKAHDIVVQNGTRHAWRNKTDKPVKMAFVLIGAHRG